MGSGWNWCVYPSSVKPHSSPWFSAGCVAAIVHRNHFFNLYQKDKSSEYKVKFRQASNRYKMVLEAAKLAYANKKKSPSLPRNLALENFDELPIVFSAKVNLSSASGPLSEKWNQRAISKNANKLHKSSWKWVKIDRLL